MILAFIYRTSQVIQKQITELTRTERELRKEKKKSDTVLYQVSINFILMFVDIKEITFSSILSRAVS